MAVAADGGQLRVGWLLLLVLLVNGVLVDGAAAVQSVTCQEAAPWSAHPVESGRDAEELLVDPMLANRGKVVLVALTSASSTHSLDQAHELALLESFFHGVKMTDITFLLVNAAQSRDRLTELIEKNLTLAIFQESANDSVWSKLGGKKDQVFIYDRCGRLTYSIPFPLSIIHPRQQLVESAVISTYLDDLCGDRHCDLEVVNTTVEDSAETEMLNTTHNILVEVTEIINATLKVDALNEQAILDNATGVPVHEHLENSTRKMEEPSQNRNTSETQNPTPTKRIWSMFQKLWRYMPWTADPKEERIKNSVRKFTDQAPTVAPTINTTESEEFLCNITRRTTCKLWPKKKLDHARECCNLRACNASDQHLQKHCKHYTKHRCQKVEIILKCCHGRHKMIDLEDSERINTKAVASFHAKS